MFLSLTVNAGTNGQTAAAKRLLESMNMEASLNGTIDAMLQLQIQRNPAMAPYKQVMKKFFSKYMSYDSLKNDFVTIYADAFTETELNDFAAFYSTPTGKKAISKMPELSSKGAQLGASRVQAHTQELQDMIKEETQRLQKLQGQ